MPFNGSKNVPDGEWFLATDNACTYIQLQGGNYEYIVKGAATATPPTNDDGAWIVPARMGPKRLNLADLTVGGVTATRIYIKSTEAQRLTFIHD